MVPATKRPPRPIAIPSERPNITSIDQLTSEERESLNDELQKLENWRIESQSRIEPATLNANYETAKRTTIDKFLRKVNAERLPTAAVVPATKRPPRPINIPIERPNITSVDQLTSEERGSLNDELQKLENWRIESQSRIEPAILNANYQTAKRTTIDKFLRKVNAERGTGR